MAPQISFKCSMVKELGHFLFPSPAPYIRSSCILSPTCRKSFRIPTVREVHSTRKISKGPNISFLNYSEQWSSRTQTRTTMKRTTTKLHRFPISSSCKRQASSSTIQGCPSACQTQERGAVSSDSYFIDDASRCHSSVAGAGAAVQHVPDPGEPTDLCEGQTLGFGPEEP